MLNTVKWNGRIYIIKLEKNFKKIIYEQFFTYFNRWLGKAIPKSIWNFSELIKNEKNTKKFYYTNSISDNINRYLNRNLKRARCFSTLFHRNILNVIQ